MKSTKVVVVINPKGGVGKSAVSFNLAHAATLAREGARVLCLDMDSQGNLSQFLTGAWDINHRTEGGVDLLLDEKELCPIPTNHPNIDLLFGHGALDKYNSVDIAFEDRCYSTYFGDLLRSLDYDYVLIDTPTSFELRHMAPLFWADIAIVPIMPVVSATFSFQDLVINIEEHVIKVNPRLEWFGIINQVNMHWNLHKNNAAEIKEMFGDKIIGTLNLSSAVVQAIESDPPLPVWKHRNARKEIRANWLNVGAKALKY